MRRTTDPPEEAEESRDAELNCSRLAIHPAPWRTSLEPCCVHGQVNLLLLFTVFLIFFDLVTLHHMAQSPFRLPYHAKKLPLPPLLDTER